jgi:small subunit ribosomal protein S20
MAQHLSAERQARKAVKHRTRNRAYMSKMKTAVKRVRAAKEKEKAVVELRKAVKLLDQLAAKGIIHKNNAANKKSSLAKFVSKLGAKAS